MTAYRRNVVVGLVVLVALIALGWMIVKFGGAPAQLFTTPKMKVRFLADRADGISNGSTIYYRGVPMGRVMSTHLNDQSRSVVIDSIIDIDPPLPANLVGIIRITSLLGAGTSIDLQLKDEQAQGKLADGTQLTAKYVGAQFLPTEFSTLAKELGDTAHQLRESGLIEHLNQTVVHAGQLSDSLNSLVSDPKFRENLQTSVASLRTATETANRIGANLEKFSGGLGDLSAKASSTLTAAQDTIAKANGHIEDLSKQVNERMVQAAQLITTFQSIAGKIDAGKGTAGLLINDPKLYDSLVDTARQINMAVADLKRLIDQWEQEGAYLKLH